MQLNDLAQKRVYPSSAIDPAYGGLTLREHYAGLALAALIAHHPVGSPERHADSARHYADTLIKQLESGL